MIVEKTKSVKIINNRVYKTFLNHSQNNCFVWFKNNQVDKFVNILNTKKIKSNCDYTIHSNGDITLEYDYISGKSLLDILSHNANNEKFINKVIEKLFLDLCNYAKENDPFFCIDWIAENIVYTDGKFVNVDVDYYDYCDKKHVECSINILQQNLKYYCNYYKINIRPIGHLIDYNQIKFKGTGQKSFF